MRSRWQFLFPLFLLVGTLFAIYLAHRSQLFAVKQITCQTDQGECLDYIQAELNSHLGQSLFFTDFYTAGERITSLAPFLAHFTLSKQFPDTVHFSFTSAEPIYVFHDLTGQPWIVDEAGYIIATAEADIAYPTIYAAPSFTFQPNLRDRVTPTLHQALLGTFAAAKELNLQEAKITLLSEQDASLKLPDGKAALFRVDYALPELTKLVYTLKRFDFSTIKEPVTELDLRFSQVILRTATTSAETLPVPNRQ
jgi:cell division septal protein FtsQ